MESWKRAIFLRYCKQENEAGKRHAEVRDPGAAGARDLNTNKKHVDKLHQRSRLKKSSYRTLQLIFRALFAAAGDIF